MNLKVPYCCVFYESSDLFITLTYNPKMVDNTCCACIYSKTEPNNNQVFKYCQPGILWDRARDEITMLKYYASWLQQCRCEATRLICGDRLFQQYIVDAFAYVEENRLRFIIKNNENLRSGIYQVYMIHCARVILMETMLVRKLYWE